MSIPHDLPSNRLRHRLLVWRDRGRHPWRVDGVAEATATDDAESATDDVDSVTDDTDTATDGREGPGLGLPVEIDLTNGTFEPWNSRSRVARYWGARPRIPHPRALILLILCAVAFVVTLSVIMTMRAAADLKRGRSALDRSSGRRGQGRLGTGGRDVRSGSERVRFGEGCYGQPLRFGRGIDPVGRPHTGCHPRGVSSRPPRDRRGPGAFRRRRAPPGRRGGIVAIRGPHTRPKRW